MAVTVLYCRCAKLLVFSGRVLSAGLGARTDKMANARDFVLVVVTSGRRVSHLGDHFGVDDGILHCCVFRVTLLALCMLSEVFALLWSAPPFVRCALEGRSSGFSDEARARAPCRPLDRLASLRGSSAARRLSWSSRWSSLALRTGSR